MGYWNNPVNSVINLGQATIYDPLKRKGTKSEHNMPRGLLIPLGQMCKMFSQYVLTNLSN